MASIDFNVGFLDNERDELGFKIKDLTVAVEINKNNYDIKDNLDLDAIRSNIGNIFHWMKGERILNPLFGNPIMEYIYEPIVPDTAKRIGAAISNAIQTWEPRVSIKNMNVNPDPDNNQYDITVYYDVPILNLYSLEYNKLITLEE